MKSQYQKEYLTQNVLFYSFYNRGNWFVLVDKQHSTF